MIFKTLVSDVLEGGEKITFSQALPPHAMRERSETLRQVVWTAVARRGSRRGGSQSLREDRRAGLKRKWYSAVVNMSSSGILYFLQGQVYGEVGFRSLGTAPGHSPESERKQRVYKYV